MVARISQSLPARYAQEHIFNRATTETAADTTLAELCSLIPAHVSSAHAASVPRKHVESHPRHIIRRPLARRLPELFSLPCRRLPTHFILPPSLTHPKSGNVCLLGALSEHGCVPQRPPSTKDNQQGQTDHAKNGVLWLGSPPLPFIPLTFCRTAQGALYRISCPDDSLHPPYDPPFPLAAQFDPPEPSAAPLKERGAGSRSGSEKRIDFRLMVLKKCKDELEKGTAAIK